MIAFESFDEYDMTIWGQTLEVNLTAVLRLPLGLKEHIAGEGPVVLIWSIDAFVAFMPAWPMRPPMQG